MIYVNGDSWSWAPDLKAHWLWANRVAHAMNTTVLNESIGCGSNSRMCDYLSNHLASGMTPNLVIIMLTSHHRWHVPAPDFASWVIGPLVALNDRTGENDDFLPNWIFKHSYDELDSIYRYYRLIWQMEILCRDRGIPICFFQAWDTDLEKYDYLNVDLDCARWPTGSTNTDRYRKCFEFFQQEKTKWHYVERACRLDLEPNMIDVTGHPNDLGHARIAEIVLKHIEGVYNV